MSFFEGNFWIVKSLKSFKSFFHLGEGINGLFDKKSFRRYTLYNLEKDPFELINIMYESNPGDFLDGELKEFYKTEGEENIRKCQLVQL